MADKMKKNVRNEIYIKFYEVRGEGIFFYITLTRDWNKSVKKLSDNNFCHLFFKMWTNIFRYRLMSRILI